MQTIYELWLAKKLFNHQKSVKTLCSLYSSAYDIYSMDRSEFSKLPNIGRTLAEKLADKNLDEAKEALDSVKKLGIKTLTFHSPSYPQSLKALLDPPYMLFVLGDESLLCEKFAIGAVGTRNMNRKSMYDAFFTSYELASTGALIVSGLANGVDTLSHLGALSAGGKTLAVIGTGTDVEYPRQNKILKQKIIESGGAIVSEYFPGTKPLPENFPRRNRIISALSHTLVVVEASRKSGALITARISVNIGKPVFYFRNWDYSLPEWTGEIAKGAYPFTSCFDLLQFLKNEGVCGEENIMRMKIMRDPIFCDGRMQDAGLIKITAPGEKYNQPESISESNLKKNGTSNKQKTASPKRKEENINPPYKVGEGYYEEKKLPNRFEKPDENMSIFSKEYRAAYDASIGVDFEYDFKERQKQINQELAFEFKKAVLEELSQIGIIPDEEMLKAIELISKNDVISTDLLYLYGCNTSALLQTITLLVQIGKLNETSGNVYRVKRGREKI